MSQTVRPLYKRQDPWARFWAKVDASASCWEWTAGLASGYGSHSIDGRNVPAHRYAWEILVGPIAEGMELDHLCRNRKCVNPDHLEPVTRNENIRRGPQGSIHAARCAARTHCHNGHEFTPENTSRNAKGHRLCRECGRIKTARYRAKRAQPSEAA